MEVIHTVTKIQGNLNMGGREYHDGDCIFLFESTEKELGLNNIKIGDRIKLYSDNNGFYIKGEII
jgi:hypothetical protein